MPTHEPQAPGWQPPPDSHVDPQAPREVPPERPEEVKPSQSRPEEWRPSDSPKSPTRVGPGEEWQPPERGPDTPANDEQVRE